MAESYPNGLKTRWEKEKLLVTSNFSFSHSVFKRLLLQTRKNQGLFRKGLMHRQKESFHDSLHGLGWFVVSGFNATLTVKIISLTVKVISHMCVGDAHVFPGFLTPVLTQLSFQSHWLLFSHASAAVRGENTPKIRENTPERNFASIGPRTHKHQVMSPTHLPLSQPYGALHGLPQQTDIIQISCYQ